MTWKNLRRVAVAITISAAFLFQEIWALAGTTGGVVGTVTDESGKPVAGAKVTATAPSGTISATTDSAGHFAFLSLAPDTYTMQVEKQGFANQSVTGVVVFADNTQTLAIRIADREFDVSS
jgi:protocatechuate 3,4-dioxygenase beta subunit